MCSLVSSILVQDLFQDNREASLGVNNICLDIVQIQGDPSPHHTFNSILFKPGTSIHGFQIIVWNGLGCLSWLGLTGDNPEKSQFGFQFKTSYLNAYHNYDWFAQAAGHEMSLKEESLSYIQAYHSSTNNIVLVLVLAVAPPKCDHNCPGPPLTTLILLVARMWYTGVHIQVRSLNQAVRRFKMLESKHIWSEFIQRSKKLNTTG